MNELAFYAHLIIANVFLAAIPTKNAAKWTLYGLWLISAIAMAVFT